ncbi:MAG: hypothetical protein CMK07_15840 [Ponticaulis sp.]|nr:hypothetical protein [Ponticaulis sp.]
MIWKVICAGAMGTCLSASALGDAGNLNSWDIIQSLDGRWAVQYETRGMEQACEKYFVDISISEKPNLNGAYLMSEYFTTRSDPKQAFIFQSTDEEDEFERFAEVTYSLRVSEGGSTQPYWHLIMPDEDSFYMERVVDGREAKSSVRKRCPEE